MIEVEWMNSNYPMGMVTHLGSAASERKLNLLAAACLRRIWHLLPGPRSRHTVEVLERYADGEASGEELASARQECWEDARLVDNPEGDKHPSEVAIAAVNMDNILDILMTAAEATAWVKAGTPEAISEPEESEQCGVVREIFGNPFRQIAIASPWRTSTVVSVARSIYNDRAFDRLPILADALEDAGCADEDVLGHLRGVGAHILECWALDLLLSRK
jgi:hypothetical protein